MREELEIDTTPCNETCVQVGHENSISISRIEIAAFIAQIKRVIPEAENAWFKIKSNRHDFGTYLSIAIVYDDNDEEAENLAYEIENNLPSDWDNEAKAYLLAHLPVEYSNTLELE